MDENEKVLYLKFEILIDFRFCFVVRCISNIFIEVFMSSNFTHIKSFNYSSVMYYINERFAKF